MGREKKSGFERNGGRRNCDQDIMYDRRISKKKQTKENMLMIFRRWLFS